MCSSLEVVTMTKRQLLAVGLILTLGGSMPSYALIGQVLNLDGQGDYVEIADSPSLHAPSELTVTGWFRSDRMVLVNAEYWIDGNNHWGQYWPADDFNVGVFFDAGSAWFADDRSDPFTGLNALVDAEGTERDIKTSVGFAIGMDELRLDLAKPLDATGGDWALSMRASRTF